MNWLYGRPDIDTMLITWVPIMYIVAIRGTIFNYASILASTLKNNIHTSKNPEADQASKIYMTSYLLDVVCVGCILIVGDITGKIMCQISCMYIIIYFGNLVIKVCMSPCKSHSSLLCINFSSERNPLACIRELWR